MKPLKLEALLVLLSTLVLLSVSVPVYAATIALIGTEELVGESELVFEGIVIDSRTELNQYGRIYTWVDFRVNDVLVGDFDAEQTLELRFSGGSAFGVELDLGVRIPELGERGIYFVEKMEPGLINPLLGWEQGHFVVDDSGLVIAANNREVRSVELRSQSEGQQLSGGVALGIETAPAYDESLALSIGDPAAAMTADAFKNKIRELAK